MLAESQKEVETFLKSSHSNFNLNDSKTTIKLYPESCKNTNKISENFFEKTQKIQNNKYKYKPKSPSEVDPDEEDDVPEGGEEHLKLFL